MTVDPGQNLNGFSCLHSFQKPPDRLKVSIASLYVMQIVNLPVNEVEINLSRADNHTRYSSDVPDTVSRFVSNYLEIISDVHSRNH